MASPTQTHLNISKKVIQYLSAYNKTIYCLDDAITAITELRAELPIDKQMLDDLQKVQNELITLSSRVSISAMLGTQGHKQIIAESDEPDTFTWKLYTCIKNTAITGMIIKITATDNKYTLQKVTPILHTGQLIKCTRYDISAPVVRDSVAIKWRYHDVDTTLILENISNIETETARMYQRGVLCYSSVAVESYMDELELTSASSSNPAAPNNTSTSDNTSAPANDVMGSGVAESNTVAAPTLTSDKEKDAYEITLLRVSDDCIYDAVVIKISCMKNICYLYEMTYVKKGVHTIMSKVTHAIKIVNSYALLYCQGMTDVTVSITFGDIIEARMGMGGCVRYRGQVINKTKLLPAATLMDTPTDNSVIVSTGNSVIIPTSPCPVTITSITPMPFLVDSKEVAAATTAEEQAARYVKYTAVLASHTNTAYSSVTVQFGLNATTCALYEMKFTSRDGSNYSRTYSDITPIKDLKAEMLCQAICGPYKLVIQLYPGQTVRCVELYADTVLLYHTH